VRGEPIEKQQALKIETLLDERQRLYETPLEGAWKVSILQDAHRMTPDAANVLLKVLEEPPKRTAIFLLTSRKDAILSTLISRCQVIRFRPLPDAQAQANLTPDQRVAIQQAETLWSQLPTWTPSQILSKTETRSRVTAAVARLEIEAQLSALLAPATRDVRAGRPQAAEKVECIQKAQQQLKQNVPANLVYDNLLIKLSVLGATS
jgi:DNA polymerase-3 subunit delta'